MCLHRDTNVFVLGLNKNNTAFWTTWYVHKKGKPITVSVFFAGKEAEERFMEKRKRNPDGKKKKRKTTTFSDLIHREC